MQRGARDALGYLPLDWGTDPVLFGGYLAFWPQEASPPGQATTEPDSTVPSAPPEEAAKRFADRQPGCVEVIRAERISDSRALSRIECEHSDGGTPGSPPPARPSTICNDVLEKSVPGCEALRPPPHGARVPR